MAEFNAALRKMTRPARRVASPAEAGEGRAWRITVPRVSHALIGLPARVSGFANRRADLAELLENWDDYPLSLRLDGPGTAPGLAQIEAGLLAGLVEIQTMGFLGDGEVEPRMATDADAALAVPVIDHWAVESGAAAGLREVWHPGRRITGLRAAERLFEEGYYDIRAVTVVLGDGERAGTVRLAVPAATAGSNMRGAEGSALMLAEAEVCATLYRVDMPLSWLRGIEVGSLLTIPRERIGRIRIETDDGLCVSRGRLGRQGNRYAVRLGDVPGAKAADGGGFDAAELTGDAAPSGPGELPPLEGPAPEPPGLPDLPGADEGRDDALPTLGLAMPMGGLPDPDAGTARD